MHSSPSINKSKRLKPVQEKTKNSLNSKIPPPLSFDKERNLKTVQQLQEETEQGETRQSPLLASKESTPRPVLLNLSPLTEDKEDTPETRHSVATSAMTQSLHSAVKKPLPSSSPVLDNCNPNPLYKQIMYPVALFSVLTIAALVVSRNR